MHGRCQTSVSCIKAPILRYDPLNLQTQSLCWKTSGSDDNITAGTIVIVLVFTAGLVANWVCSEFFRHDCLLSANRSIHTEAENPTWANTSHSLLQLSTLFNSLWAKHPAGRCIRCLDFLASECMKWIFTCKDNRYVMTVSIVHIIQERSHRGNGWKTHTSVQLHTR